MRLGSVNYETRGKVAILTLDEPNKLNALSAGIRQGILNGLTKADADDAIRVAVITGAGDKAFCAGADISDFDFDPEKARSFLVAALEVLAAPENTRKPVISAVNGIAYGGGFELAIASDFVIASERARFAVPEIKLGLLPAFAIVRLQEIVGRPKAKEMSMLGDPISAEEACRLGLVLRVVPHDEVLAEAIAFAERIASKPRLAVQMAKSFYNRGLGGDEMRHVIDGFFRFCSCMPTRAKASRLFARSASRNSARNEPNAACPRERRQPVKAASGGLPRPATLLSVAEAPRGAPSARSRPNGRDVRQRSGLHENLTFVSFVGVDRQEKWPAF